MELVKEWTGPNLIDGGHFVATKFYFFCGPITLDASQIEEKEKQDFMVNFISNDEIQNIVLETNNETKDIMTLAEIRKVSNEGKPLLITIDTDEQGDTPFVTPSGQIK